MVLQAWIQIHISFSPVWCNSAMNILQQWNHNVWRQITYSIHVFKRDFSKSIWDLIQWQSEAYLYTLAWLDYLHLNVIGLGFPLNRSHILLEKSPCITDRYLHSIYDDIWLSVMSQITDLKHIQMSYTYTTYNLIHTQI